MYTYDIRGLAGTRPERRTSAVIERSLPCYELRQSLAVPAKMADYCAGSGHFWPSKT